MTMNKSLLCLSLLAYCLSPCAAQTKNSLTPLHVRSRPAALHTSASKPEALRPVVTGGPFPDVPKDHWAAAAVETLRQKGIVVGYPPSR